MSLSEERKLLLSQLVDGELPVDQANHVLADVLDKFSPEMDDAETAGYLRAMLQLRQALSPWRQQIMPGLAVSGSTPAMLLARRDR